MILQEMPLSFHEHFGDADATEIWLRGWGR